MASINSLNLVKSNTYLKEKYFFSWRSCYRSDPILETIDIVERFKEQHQVVREFWPRQKKKRKGRSNVNDYRGSSERDFCIKRYRQM